LKWNCHRTNRLSLRSRLHRFPRSC
jgi:hypothetical protein